MQKTIIKTAIITLCAVIILGALAFGSVSIFAPVSMGDFYSEMGREERALECYVRAYEKEKNEENFVKVINSSILAEDNEKLIKYFPDYDAENYQLDEDYLTFIVGKYCVAQASADKLEEAYATAVKYAGGYKEQNPVRYLIAYGLETQNKGYLTDLLSKLTDYKLSNYSTLSEQDQARLDQDITNLTTYCADN